MPAAGPNGEKMEVRVDSLFEGASRAEGTVVIVDVYRAFTTAAVAFSRGAERIVLVPDIEEALALRTSGACELCIGEMNFEPARFCRIGHASTKKWNFS